MSSFLQMPEQEVAKLLSHPFLYTLPSLFLVLFLIKWLFFTQTTPKSPPPTLPKLPIIGNFHQLGLLPHKSLGSLAQQYGPVMLLHIGAVPTLVVSSADAAREIMKTHDVIFSNRPESRLWRRLLYDMKGVGTSPYGEHWRQLKSIMVFQLLSNKRVQSFRELREEEIALMMDKIRVESSSSTTKNVVDLSDMLLTLTNNIVCRVAFGRKYSEGEGWKKIKVVLKELLVALGGFNVGDYIPWLGWVDRVSGVDGKVDRIAKGIDEFLEGVVEDHLKKKSFGGECREDFVDILLKTQKDDTTGFSLDRVSLKALLLVYSPSLPSPPCAPCMVHIAIFSST